MHLLGRQVTVDSLGTSRRGRTVGVKAVASGSAYIKVPCIGTSILMASVETEQIAQKLHPIFASWITLQFTVIEGLTASLVRVVSQTARTSTGPELAALTQSPLPQSRAPPEAPQRNGRYPWKPRLLESACQHFTARARPVAKSNRRPAWTIASRIPLYFAVHPRKASTFTIDSFRRLRLSTFSLPIHSIDRRAGQRWPPK